MKVYRQDPTLFRDHFHRQVGGALPGFKGARVQYGDGIGSFLGAMARKAIPLIRAGIKLAAPHVKKAGKDIAQEIAGHAVQKVSQAVKRPRKTRKRVTKRRKVKAARPKDIFTQ